MAAAAQELGNESPAPRTGCLYCPWIEWWASPAVAY